MHAADIRMPSLSYVLREHSLVSYRKVHIFSLVRGFPVRSCAHLQGQRDPDAWLEREEGKQYAYHMILEALRIPPSNSSSTLPRVTPAFLTDSPLPNRSVKVICHLFINVHLAVVPHHWRCL
jgi:hypothetical protein